MGSPCRRAVACVSTIDTGRGTCPLWRRLRCRRFFADAERTVRRASCAMKPQVVAVSWTIRTRPSITRSICRSVELKRGAVRNASGVRPKRWSGPGSASVLKTRCQLDTGRPSASKNAASRASMRPVEGWMLVVRSTTATIGASSMDGIGSRGEHTWVFPALYLSLSGFVMTPSAANPRRVRCGPGVAGARVSDFRCEGARVTDDGCVLDEDFRRSGCVDESDCSGCRAGRWSFGSCC